MLPVDLRAKELACVAHVLVVDDQQEICEVLKEGLETAEEFYVSCSSRGADAVEILQEHRPDFAVVDVLLPEVNGVAVARTAVECGVPVLFMTGSPDMAREFSGSQVPHVLKPFRLEALLTEVRRQISNVEDNLRRVRAYIDGTAQAAARETPRGRD
jgi:DNA-binding response OmpR family regulator